jgi:putative acetyltransferase
MLEEINKAMIEIRHIESDGVETNIIRQLFTEYAAGLDENLCFQGFEEELQNPFKKYAEPEGCLLLAYWKGEAAGCIALQPLENAVCEMKRLYVRPAYRSYGIAYQLVDVLLKDARRKGYKKMVLDTLEKLQPAITLYTKFGFKNTSPYYYNPLNSVVYMEKEL